VKPAIVVGNDKASAAARPPSLTEEAAAWYVKLRYADLPEDVRAATKLRVLDIIGLMLAGSSLEYGRIARKAALKMGEGSGARILGFGDRVPPMSAAVANGLMAHSLEYDDTHNETLVHASVTSVTAALALAEAQRTTGEEVLTAIAGANEIACRIGVITPGLLHKNGFHSTAVVGTFSASYLAGRLLGATAAQHRHALGIAGSMSAGILECWTDFTHSKAIHPGWAAHCGIAAAHLAQAGLTGPATVLEGKWGFVRSHVQDPGYKPSYERMLAGLGVEWESRNLSFKPFPVGHVSHPFIDAILHLHRAGLRAADVKRITCHIKDDWIPIVCEPVAEKLAPPTSWHGRVSLQYTLAEALYHGRLDVNSYDEESLRNPEILALARKVDYVVDPTAPGRQQFKGWVVAETTDGRLERIEPFNRGSAQNPMSDEDIRAKFRDNAAPVLPKERLEAIVAAVDSLDHAGTLTTLIDLCVSPQP
jgi:2-methylcitrate dehydratase PrpD